MNSQLASGFDEQVRLTRPQYFTVARLAGLGLLLVVLGIADLDVDAASKRNVLLAVGSVMPLCVLYERFVPVARRDFVFNLTAIAACGAAAWFAPLLWVPGLIAVVLLIAAALPLDSIRRLAIQAPFGLGLFALIAESHEVESWPVAIATGSIMVGAVFVYLVQFRVRRAETTRHYDTLLANAGMFFWEISEETGLIESMSGNTVRSLGWKPEELVGRKWRDLVVDDDGVLGALVEAGDIEEIPLVDTLEHRDGSERVFRHLVRRVPSRGVFQGVATEISELAAATETIRYQAEHDELTGLHNRKVLIEQLENCLAEPDASAALLMVDLNRFKEINDTLGHHYGDRVLCVLANRFTDELEADVVARLGGDEFAFLLKGGTESAARRLADQVSELVEERVQVEDLSLSVSGSIGIALAPDDGSTRRELMQRADIAMYESKRSGGPRRYTATPEELSVERLQLVSDIAGAAQAGQFGLALQPKVELSTGDIIGAEALARWHHPDRGELLPVDFLDLLHVAGEYHDFTDAILAQSVAFAAATCRAGVPIEVAVNLSSVSFFDQGLPERIGALLTIHALPPNLLKLEITESDLLEDHERSVPIFERLVRLGVGISIDDFGTGHSSLKRLRRLPVTEVKIDRSFVSGLEIDAEDLVIVRSIIDLATLLDLEIVAEGVESEAEAQVLAGLGCEAAQGWLFSRGLSPEAMLELLVADALPWATLPIFPAGVDRIAPTHPSVSAQISGSH